MNIAILGAGESGVGAAILAKMEGAQVFVSDYGKIKADYKAELEQYEIEYEEGKHTFERIAAADVIVKSPGIPRKVPIIRKLESLQKEVIDEIELTFRVLKARGDKLPKIIAITGSNGKTTTTSLTYHILKTAGRNVGVGGNIGFSWAKQVALQKRDIYVLEISSFQLDYCKTFHPYISVVINITPDHLDQYDYQIEKYAASKLSITKNQTALDNFIHHYNDPITVETIQSIEQREIIAPHKIPIKVKYDTNGNLRVNHQTFEVDAIAIKGIHNHFNATIAITIAQIFDVSQKDARKALASFVNAPHRMEYITNINGVDYINDSKATNIDAALQALKSMTKPVVWVAGGRDKGNDYSVLAQMVKEKVKAMVCLCDDSSKLIAAFKDIIPIIKETKDAAEAVAMSQALADTGDVVLLAPACSSFDLFVNFAARGDQFREAVLNISKKAA